MLERLYREHKYIKNGKGMDEKEMKFFDSVSSRMPDDVAVLALKYLSDYLEDYYGKKVLIFLDEYDTPLQEAYVYGYWEELGRKPSEEAEPERFYHGFVLGLMVELAGRYRITSNRESGFGRYDVMLEPLKAGDSAFVLEFKVRDPEDEKTLADTVSAALLQIEEKAYDMELLVRGISPERIRHYGFAFEGKTVLIG